MKLVIIVLLAFSSQAFAQSRQVRGYVRDNGTYVQPYQRSIPDATPYNNRGYQQKRYTMPDSDTYTKPNYKTAISPWEPDNDLTNDEE